MQFMNIGGDVWDREEEFRQARMQVAHGFPESLQGPSCRVWPCAGIPGVELTPFHAQILL